MKTDRMFLTANPFWNRGESSAWYKNSPVGINEISKWVKYLAKEIGLDVKRRKISNHSIRSSAVSALAKAGVGEHQLMKITGHSNVNSIKSYLQLDHDHHKVIIDEMRRNISTTTTVASSLASNSSVGSGNSVLAQNNDPEISAKEALLQHCNNVNFSNCSFHLFNK